LSQLRKDGVGLTLAAAWNRMFTSPHFLGAPVASCLIGVGANLGDRAEAIGLAGDRLREHESVDSLRASRQYATKPIGGPDGQAEFVNAAFHVQTSLPPATLLQLLQQIEEAAGRTKAERWGARRLDLDLLLYDEAIIEQRELIIPHPRMAFRRFVLEPAAEIAGRMTHPTTSRTVAELASRLDKLAAYIAISNAASAERQSLLLEVAAQTNALPLLAPTSLGGSSGDSPSPGLASAIEFLDQRVQAVNCIDPRQKDRVWVSDFWLGDALLAARRSLPPGVFSEFADVWAERESQMPEPIVVVLFDAAKNTLNALQQARLPVLRLNSADSDWNRQEVAAALEALKK